MIEVSHVSRIFGDFCAVNDVSFSIPTGEIVGLLGPNGAGKTTTMRMITGFLEMSSGSIKIDGKDIREDPVRAKRKIGTNRKNRIAYRHGVLIEGDKGNAYTVKTGSPRRIFTDSA